MAACTITVVDLLTAGVAGRQPVGLLVEVEVFVQHWVQTRQLTASLQVLLE